MWSLVTLDEVFPKQLIQLCEGLVDPRPCISYTFGKVLLCHWSRAFHQCCPTPELALSHSELLSPFPCMEHPTACAHMVQESSLAHPNTFWETYFGCLNNFYCGCNTRSSQIAEEESEETHASPLLRNEGCLPRAVVFLWITAALL